MAILSILSSWTSLPISYLRLVCFLVPFLLRLSITIVLTLSQLSESLRTPDCTGLTRQFVSSATNNVSKKPQDHRTEMIARLRGQEIYVPDVYYIYTDWLAKVHPGVQLLRDHLEGYFREFISTESQRKKQRRVDNGLCAGYFWTHVEPEKFIVLGELVAWVNQLRLFDGSLLM
jgi:hypothetical protein